MPRINTPYVEHKADPIDQPVQEVPVAETVAGVAIIDQVVDTGAGPESDLDIADGGTNTADSSVINSPTFVEESTPIAFGGGSFYAMDPKGQSTFSYV